MSTPETRKLEPGDYVRFKANGARGRVVTNHGPAVNTKTGNDGITWADAPNYYSHNVHDASQLELIPEDELCADCLAPLDDHCGECGECACEDNECEEETEDSDETETDDES